MTYSIVTSSKTGNTQAVADAIAAALPPEGCVYRGAPAPEDMASFRELLAAAKQPLVILGGGGWDAKACDDIRAFIEANHLPVTTAFRNQDLIDNRHPQFVGDLGIGVNAPLGCNPWPPAQA